MRILLTIDTFGLIGGSERYAELVACGLAERGHELAVLCARSDGSSRSGARVLADEVTSYSRLDRGARDRIAAAVGGFRPDIVYALAARTNDLFALLLELAPVVRHVQDHTLFCPGMNKLHEDGTPCERKVGLACLEHYWLRGGCSGFKIGGARPRPIEALHRVAARRRDLGRHARAAKLVVASRYMQAELVRAGIASEHVVVLPYFTRSNTADIPREPLSTATEAFLSADARGTVFTPARLALPDKGVDYLITALAGAREPFRLVVAGSGPAEAWLREKAARELGACAHFTGWLGAGAMETLYAHADVVVCPSVWNEPFGLVGLEAMAHAKPVVAFQVGGIPEWLADGETGALVERRDTHALARAIDVLLADPDLRSRQGRAGAERLEREFSRRAHLDQLETLLAEARGGETTSRTEAPRDAGKAGNAGTVDLDFPPGLARSSGAARPHRAPTADDAR